MGIFSKLDLKYANNPRNFWGVKFADGITPRPGDERARMGELPLGEPGYYVNVTFGYWMQHPPDWYTDFGNRPLLVSLSDLDPGTHNRNSMRAEGCLIEINAAANIYGFTFEELMGQMPRTLSISTFRLQRSNPHVLLPLPCSTA